VTEPPSNRTILIVDEDLGFVLWLGQLIKELGYLSLPASSCRQAASHIEKLNVSVSVAIVNPGLRGSSQLLQALVAVSNRTRIILIRDRGVDIPPGISASATLEKPSSWDRISHEDWLYKVRRALTDAPLLAARAAVIGGSS